ncbi:MAG TPA: ABC transporter permease [Candidatus Limnocylindrales bacterium]|nr:ABC transporter permease [Candidatus Limnocylindrales bacterium]
MTRWQEGGEPGEAMLTRLRSLIENLTRRRRRDEELDSEVRAYAEMLAEQKMREGMTPEEARRTARIELGGVEQVKEQVREARAGAWLDSLLQDLRYGLRMLRKSPGFAAVAIVTLALGIGANTAIFSVVNAVLLRPLPYSQPSRLVRIEEAHPDIRSINFSYANYVDLAAAPPENIESIAAYRFWTYNITGNGEPEQALGAMVSPAFFSMLGVAPQIGRGFLAGEDLPGKENVVVIGFGLWQRRFGGAADVIGKTLNVSDEPHVVVGVMPAGFQFPESAEIWTPLVTAGKVRNNRRSHLLQVVARLRAGATLPQLRAQLDARARSIAEQNPGVDPGFAMAAGELQERIVAPVRPALLVLLGAVGFLLLIACANVGNVILMRNSRRSREFAVRAALGARAGRLARQLLAESVLLGTLGGAAGLAVAGVCLRLIVRFGPPDVPRLDQVTLDARVLLATLGISLASALLFGLIPALTAARSDPNDSLKEGAKGTLGRGRSRLRGALVVAEIALALVLLAGGGLLLNSFERLSHVELGFDPQNVLTMNLFISPTRHSDAQIGPMLEQMAARIRALPGVTAAGSINSLPGVGGIGTDFEIEGRPNSTLGEEPSADICMVTDDYFRTMRIPLLRGREFTSTDSATSPAVMVINSTMARRYWPNEDPLGKRVTMKDWGPPRQGVIIGIVGDVKSGGLDALPRNMIYWPVTQFAEIFHNVVVRTAGDPNRLVGAIENQVWAVDPDQPIASIQTMDGVLADSLAPRRLQTVLLGGFAMLALVIAAVGIYGVMAYSMSSRRHEIGIRMTLGASSSAVRRLALREGATLALLGVGLGVGGALATTHFLARMLYGVRPDDPFTFMLAAALLGCVALAACYVPAWRASRVDPTKALRYE